MGDFALVAASSSPGELSRWICCFSHWQGNRASRRVTRTIPPTSKRGRDTQAEACLCCCFSAFRPSGGCSAGLHASTTLPPQLSSLRRDGLLALPEIVLFSLLSSSLLSFSMLPRWTQQWSGYLDMEAGRGRVPMGSQDAASKTHAVFAFGVHDDTPVSFSCSNPIFPPVLLTALVYFLVPTPSNNSEKWDPGRHCMALERVTFIVCFYFFRFSVSSCTKQQWPFLGGWMDVGSAKVHGLPYQKGRRGRPAGRQAHFQLLSTPFQLSPYMFTPWMVVTGFFFP